VNHQHDPLLEPATQAADPLRVCLVTETFAPEVNGVAMTLGHLVRGLLMRDHSVQVVRPQQAVPSLAPRDPRLQEVLTTGFPIPGYSSLRFGMASKSRLMALWKQQRPDVVHVATEGPLGWSAVAAARAMQVPLTSSFHTNFDAYSGHYGLGLLKAPIDAYLRALHNRTLATLIPTASQMEALQARGYRNVSVMARGVDTALFNPTKRLASLRIGWGLQEDDLAVVHVGRLAKEKNLEVVLKAFKAIQLREPKARLILVGDGPLLQGLQSSVQRVILAGVQRGEDLAAHYASGDVFLFPSVTETYGNVVPEALASGLAVVAYQYASAAMLIRHETSGLLAAFDDEPAFLLQALRVATDQKLRATLRESACASVAHLSWDTVCESFIATLRSASLQGANGVKPIKTPTQALQPSA
jgi:glycosyltransferase involved in cell wall biosynthesis